MPTPSSFRLLSAFSFPLVLLLFLLLLRPTFATWDPSFCTADDQCPKRIRSYEAIIKGRNCAQLSVTGSCSKLCAESLHALITRDSWTRCAKRCNWAPSLVQGAENWLQLCLQNAAPPAPDGADAVAGVIAPHARRVPLQAADQPANLRAASREKPAEPVVNDDSNHAAPDPVSKMKEGVKEADSDNDSYENKRPSSHRMQSANGRDHHQAHGQIHTARDGAKSDTDDKSDVDFKSEEGDKTDGESDKALSNDNDESLTQDSHKRHHRQRSYRHYHHHNHHQHHHQEKDDENNDGDDDMDEFADGRGDRLSEIVDRVSDIVVPIIVVLSALIIFYITRRTRVGRMLMQLAAPFIRGYRRLRSRFVRRRTVIGKAPLDIGPVPDRSELKNLRRGARRHLKAMTSTVD